MKRIPALRDLSDDHHTGLVLGRACKEAARSEDPDMIAQTWSRVRSELERHLEPHFQIEEEWLLAGLETIGETDFAARIREDHDRIRALARSATQDAATLRALAEQLTRHIRFEERSVFEATQHRLSPETLDAIATACQRMARTLPPET